MSSDKIKCTISVLTFNSEKKLRDNLESVKDFDEIIICDGGSSDRTLDIAREYGCKIIYQDEKYKYPNNKINDFSGVRNQMLDIAQHDWFVVLDSDEIMTEKLRGEIVDIVNSDTDVHYYGVAIEWVYPDGRLVRYSGAMPSYQIRLFKRRSGVRFIKKLHERINYDRKNDKLINLEGRRRGKRTYEEDKNWWTKANYYLKIEMERCGDMSLSRYFKSFRNQMRKIAVRIIKAAYYQIKLSKKERLPLKIEVFTVIHKLKMLFLKLKKIKLK